MPESQASASNPPIKGDGNEEDNKRLKPKLMERISCKDARIAVVGMGYIGLPLAIRFVEKGFSVIGCDVSPSVIEKLQDGESIIEGIRGIRLRQAISKGLELVLVNRDNPAASDSEVINLFIGVDVFIICVPTPLDQERGWEPDTGYIKKACRMINRICQVEEQTEKLRDERLVVLESTTYPGTTKEIFSPLLKRFGNNGRKWYLAYSPERASPGLNAYQDKRRKIKAARPSEEQHPGTFQITRIVGGIDEESRKIGEALYNNIFNEVRTVENLETAEMVKLVENTFRFIAIAFANEMAIIAKTLGLNVWEIIDAAKTKGFGFELCFPGLIGGHCLPIDPHYLISATRKRRLVTTFVDNAERAHQNMRREAFDLIQRLLNQRNRGIARAAILFFGVSYKKDVGDIRESAAIKLMQQLYAADADIFFWDPVRAKHPTKPHLRMIFTAEEKEALPAAAAAKLKWDSRKRNFFIEPEELLGDWKSLRRRILSSEFHCVVLATDHADFRSAYAELIRSNDPPLADLTNAISWWLRDAALEKDEKEEIRGILNNRRKYMLLGVH